MPHRVSIAHAPGTPHRSSGRHRGSQRPPVDRSVAAAPELYTGYPAAVAREVASPWGPLATHHHHAQRRYYRIRDPHTGALRLVQVDSHGAIVQPKAPAALPDERAPLRASGHPGKAPHPAGSSTAPVGRNSRNYTPPPPHAIPAIAARRPRE